METQTILASLVLSLCGAVSALWHETRRLSKRDVLCQSEVARLTETLASSTEATGIMHEQNRARLAAIEAKLVTLARSAPPPIPPPVDSTDH